MSEKLTIAHQACKNCAVGVSSGSSYCNHCGAKVVSKRITVKSLVSDVLRDNFGWDNKFFFTIKSLVLRPGVLLREYFDGTRKKYVNPFTFLAIGTAINLFAFNFFDEEFLNVMSDLNTNIIAGFADMFGEKIYTPEVQKKAIEDGAKSTRFMLKYFNLLVLVLLPVYAFLSLLTYRKPYNFAEHLIVNSYVQGISFLSTTLLFFASIAVHPAAYFMIYPLLILYYTYGYGKLYKLSVGESILKIILFITFLLIAFVGITVIGSIIGVLIAKVF